MEGLGEETREEEQRGALVEAVAGVGEEAATAACEGVFFEDCYVEAGAGEARCCCYAAYSCSCEMSC